MFDGDVENKVRSVKTQITYVARGSFVNRRFVAPGIEHNTGHYEPHTDMVRDGRSIASHFSLDVHGFSLFHHKSAVQDFFNKEEVDRTYPGEVAEAVKMSTGASSVATIGWMVRTSGDLSKYKHETVGYSHRGGVQPPRAKLMSTPRRPRRSNGGGQRREDAVIQGPIEEGGDIEFLIHQLLRRMNRKLEISP